MMKIAPSREKPTAMRVVVPKLLMMGNVARQSAENPKNVARPETVMALPIFMTLSWMAAIGSCNRSSSYAYRSMTRMVYSAATPIAIDPSVAVSGLYAMPRRYIMTAFHPTMKMIGMIGETA